MPERLPEDWGLGKDGDVIIYSGPTNIRERYTIPIGE